MVTPAQNVVGFCNPGKLPSLEYQRNQMLDAEGCKLAVLYFILTFISVGNPRDQMTKYTEFVTNFSSTSGRIF